MKSQSRGYQRARGKSPKPATHRRLRGFDRPDAYSIIRRHSRTLGQWARHLLQQQDRGTA
jgi:hypothetical protein